LGAPIIPYTGERIKGILEHPLFFWYVVPAFLAIIAATSFRQTISWNIPPYDYFSLPFGYWSYLILGILSLAMPWLVRWLGKPEHDKTRKAKVFAIFVGAGYAFSGTSLILFWIPLAHYCLTTPGAKCLPIP
jgi:hypothetical protein